MLLPSPPKALSANAKDLHSKVNANTQQLSQRDLMINFPKVTRVEVIDNDGRRYVKYNVKSVNLSLQDDERTLKLFVEYEPEEDISID